MDGEAAILPALPLLPVEELCRRRFLAPKLVPFAAAPAAEETLSPMSACYFPAHASGSTFILRASSQVDGRRADGDEPCNSTD